MTDHAADRDRQPDPTVTRLVEEIRRRRKDANLSHAQLASQIGYSRQYISLAERATKGLPSAELINALDSRLAANGALVALRQEAVAARLAKRRSRTFVVTDGGTVAMAPGSLATPSAAGRSARALSPLRDALLRNADGEHADPASSPLDSADVKAATAKAHAHYQGADYDAAGQLVSLVVSCLNRSRSAPRRNLLQTEQRIEAAAYLVAAKLANKLGDVGLGMLAADRALRLAQEADQPGLVALAKGQLACALIHARHEEVAEQVAADAVEQLARTATWETNQRTAEILSAHGALLLLLAVLAGRRGDNMMAQDRLGNASKLAEQLGQDRNCLWTAFGPTNVRIHELAVLVGLGDTKTALQLGAVIPTDRLPSVLRGRRSQVHVELAQAAAEQTDDGLCVLHLLEAERVATQAVSHHAQATGLLRTLLGRERQGSTPGLRALAARAGVLA